MAIVAEAVAATAAVVAVLAVTVAAAVDQGSVDHIQKINLMIKKLQCLSRFNKRNYNSFLFA